VTYLAFKETFTAEEGSARFLSLCPPEDPLRTDACRSEAGLTRPHDLKALTQSAYFNAVARHDGRMKLLASAASEFLNLLA